jgi:hypothetical protein
MKKLGSYWTALNEISDLSLFRKSVEKIQIWQTVTRITGTSHEYQDAFLIISRSVLLRVTNVSDRVVERKKNTFYGH